nr:MAG TPA: hypothetical protein [Caudoviricetes sp.]
MVTCVSIYNTSTYFTIAYSMYFWTLSRFYIMNSIYLTHIK